MGGITREQMAKELVQQALENGGELGVAALEQACKKFLDETPYQGLRGIATTTVRRFPKCVPKYADYEH